MPTERIWILIAHKLTGEANENELQELQELLCSHPNEHYTIDIIQEQWKQQILNNPISSEKSFEKVWNKLQVKQLLRQAQKSTFTTTSRKSDKSYSPSIKKWGYILIAAMLITGGIWLTIPNQKLPHIVIKKESNEVSTKFGSKTKLILPDSTQVWLNGGSKLIYGNDYGQNIREVKLIGEAYFDVTHNAEKPFIIHTDKMDIKVLGTAFNVKCYPNEKSMETSLIRGSIQVTLKNKQSQKIMLKPNEKLVLNEPENIPLPKLALISKAIANQKKPTIAIQQVTYDETENTVVESSWIENKLIFRAQNFEDLALQLEHWYGVKINFQGESLKKVRLTGIFKKETIDQALSYLKLTAHFRYSIDQDNINIF